MAGYASAMRLGTQIFTILLMMMARLAQADGPLSVVPLESSEEAMALALRPATFNRSFNLRKFYRGNTHAHSLRSDGDSPAEAVVRHYQELGYNFLVLTDHNVASQRGEFAAYETPAFKTIAGEEISYWTAGAGGRTVNVHVNALCARHTSGGASVNPASQALRQAIEMVNAQPGAVAQINHPNYEWALTYADLAAVTGAPLLEIANQHPYVNNAGDRTHPSVESLWDRLLSGGRVIYGVASDDAHDLLRRPPHQPRTAGLGWVQVAATDLSDYAICEALRDGRFYSSTGVELEGIDVQEDVMMIASKGAGLVTEFIGDGGRVLSSVTTPVASYRLKGTETYVRARVRDPRTGAQAWVQPIFRRR